MAKDNVPDFSRLTFKEAFAAARKGGGDEFSWNGKRYTTELADEKPKVKKAVPDESMAEKTRLRRQDDAAGPSVESLPEKKKRSMELPKVEYDDDANDAIMSAMPGGSALKAVRGAATKLAARGQKAEKAAERVEPGMWETKTLNPRGDLVKKGTEKVADYMGRYEPTMKKGGMVGSSASRRADGCAVRGKTKGRIV